MFGQDQPSDQSGPPFQSSLLKSSLSQAPLINHDGGFFSAEKE